MAKKEIVGYEGLYEVTDQGDVISIKSGPGTYGVPTKLKQQLSTKGYAQVRLYDKEGNGRTLRVHRLVAIAFIENPTDLPQINHKDRNKLNNNISNLEWCDNQKNTEHASAKTYKLVNKLGEIVEIFNMNKWCKDNGLHSSSMARVLNGSRTHYRGWRLYA